jgi:fatty-acid desaturase
VLGIIDYSMLIELWVIPVAITNWILGLTVYMVHTYGYRNHSTNDNSKNLWWISLIMWGEGWHNNHHASPAKSNFKTRWWEIDIGYWVVKFIRV